MHSSVYVVKVDGLPVGHFDAQQVCNMATLSVGSLLSPSERDSLSEIEAAIRADLSKAARRN